MKNKRFKRLGAVILAAAMVLQSFGGMAGVYAAENQTQMESDKELVYLDAYGSDVREQNFDDNWKFYLGDVSGAENEGYDDSSWRNVTLPHDYSIEGEYTSRGEAESGYLLGGTGWYRKHFKLSSDVEGKEVRIDFGGVYMNATVWVNGTKLGTHPFGYTPFSFDITDYVNAGEDNVITVKVDHKTPSSRWYSGSGIYRSVNLTVTDLVHVDLYGTQITTPNLEKEQGKTVNMTVNTTVANAGSSAKDVVLTHTIYEKGTENSIGTVTTEVQSVKAGTTANISATLAANNPKLWDTKTPNLYTVVTEVKVGGTVVDTYETEYGFRYFAFNNNTGFTLNGEKVKLKGVCMHHDQGALGAEAHARAIERQVEILKEMGCNAIRITHNPAADEMIEACNKHGMLVIEEAFDGWLDVKNGNTYDYSNWFDQYIESGNQIVGGSTNMTWAEFDIKAMVGRGKNAPSIIMWSLGNEVQEGTYWESVSQFPQVAANLIKWVQEVDQSRPVTNGDNELQNLNAQLVAVDTVIANAGGVVGANYANNTEYDKIHNAYPSWPIYGSETASHINSRGVYNVTGSSQLNSDKALTAYDYSAVGWGATASSAWYDVITRDYVAGEFVWTGFDYMGEPTPNNGISTGWVNGSNSPKNSFFGIIDTAGLPKDNYYFYQSQWNDEVNTLHVLPAWNRNVLANPNNVPVVVYSDAASVKLELITSNGTTKDLGTKTFVEKTTAAGFKYQMASASSSNHQDMYFTWYVPFEEGTLKATAYDKAGNVISETVGRSTVTTTGAAAKVDATADRTTVNADGKDLVYITVDIKDANGNIVPDAKNNVKFTVEGEGTLVGVDNGKQSDHQSFQDDNRDAFNGSLIAIVQTTKNAGNIKVTATASGLTSDTVTIKTTGAEAEDQTAIYMSKNYYVPVGQKPVLPEKLEVRYADGTSEELAVVWNAIDDASYKTAGTFNVAGTVGGEYGVSVKVYVIDEIGALLNYSVTTGVGVVPTLPATRPAVMKDGTVMDAAFVVEWDAIKESDCAQVGTFVVDGVANVFGTEVPVTASIRVQEAKSSIGESLSPQAMPLSQDIPKEMQSDVLESIRNGVTSDVDDTNERWSNWNNAKAGDHTSEITFQYATQQRFGEIVIHFMKDDSFSRYPAAGTTEIYISETGEDGTWTKLDVTESLGTESGRVKPYTYSFEPITSTFVKFCFTDSTEITTGGFACTAITEIELKAAVLGAMSTNDTTGLSKLTVNGVEASEAELASGEFYTLDTEVTVAAEGKGNAAVTVLPAYNEKVVIITESEDHENRDKFIIYLGQEKAQDPADASKDYPVTKLTAIAGSELPYYSATKNEGAPSMILDGKEDTHWHTNWSNNSTEGQNVENRWVGVKLAEADWIGGIRYLPRTYSGTNGAVTEYRVEYRTSDDGEWIALTTGKWEETDSSWKLITFDSVLAKQVRVVGVHTWADSGNDAHMSTAEFRVVTGKEGTAPKPTETEAPKPTETEAPKPTVTEAPKPTVTEAPKPTVTEAPVPTETEAPQPTATPEATEDVKTVFTDVHKDWYTDYVQYVYDNGLMTGIKGTTQFQPNANITKAQVAQVLYNMEGQPAVTDKDVFTDLKDVYAGEWYANAVAWAYNTGVVTGDTNAKKFFPNADVTREQLALMMFRYAQFKKYDVSASSDLAGLKNAENVNNWALDGVKWAVGAGLISGVEKNGVKDLQPQGNASRAQMAAILQRFCENVK